MGVSKENRTKRNKAGKPPAFDLENPELPPQIEEAALASGGYPYTEKLKGKDYKETLLELQLELLKLQSHIQNSGARLVVVPGGGHLLNLTSPKEFEAAVAPFLRQ